MNKMFILKLIALILMWVVWNKSADIMYCWLFWLLIVSVTYSTSTDLKYARGCIILGVSCNAVVTLVNNGIMPVVGMPVTLKAAHPIWQVARSSNQMLMLADHSSLWYFSIGDLILQLGCIILFVEALQIKRRKHENVI
jgi:hypothetical protein